MKPSEIINKKYKELYTKKNINPDSSDSIVVYLQALATYLDEEKERVNNILHEIVSSVEDRSGNFVDKRFINLHAMIDETLAGSDK